MVADDDVSFTRPVQVQPIDQNERNCDSFKIAFNNYQIKFQPEQLDYIELGWIFYFAQFTSSARFIQIFGVVCQRD